ncbi:MAG: cbb3-type cytochrome oxidase assembly protein CcoS [Polyangiales bacterium]
MEVLALLLFLSLFLVFAAVVFFAWTVNRQEHAHSEHLALLALDDDEPSTSPRK